MSAISPQTQCPCQAPRIALRSASMAQVGRPSKYDPAFCDTIIRCGTEGMTLAEMADALDVDRATIADWREHKPEFSRAVNLGLQKAQAWWERQGRIATFGGCDGYNATSYIFQMKNRFREDWRDKQDVDVNASVTVNIARLVSE